MSKITWFHVNYNQFNNYNISTVKEEEEEKSNENDNIDVGERNKKN